MKKHTPLLLFVLFMGVSSAAFAGPFYAIANEVPYQGTIWNITTGGGPWATSTPRTANLFVTVSAPQVWSDSNDLLSSWLADPNNNQNDSFFQLWVDGAQSPWSGTGDWDPSLEVFTLNVVGGHDGDWLTSYSRFWQPDQGDAWGVTFLGYQYSFVATFASPATEIDGWYVSSGTPTSIFGTFSGTFQRSQDYYGGPEVTNGDVYGFLLDFAWAPEPNGGDEPYSEFGTPVPEPGSMMLLGSGLIGLAGMVRRRIRK